MNRPVMLIGAAVAAVLLVSSAAIAVGAVDLRSEPRVEPTTSAVSTDVASTVGTLARERTNADELPPKMRANIERVDGSGPNPGGFNIDLTRRVRSTQGADVWLAPGAGKVCLISREPAGPGFTVNCLPVALVQQGRLTTEWVGGQDPDARASTVVGVVPDKVSSVTVTDRNGSRQTLPVVENVYAAPSGQPREVSFEGPNGQVRARIR